MEEIKNSENEMLWIDLCDPTPEEIHSIQTTYKIIVPSRAELEVLPRNLQKIDDIISVKVINALPIGSEEIPTPLGFILTPDLLITIRYVHLPSFDLAKENIKKCPVRSSYEAFTIIMEQVVNISATALEKLSVSVTLISREVFRQYATNRQYNIARSNKRLRATLLTLGKYGEELSQIREIQIGLQRIIPFILEKGQSLSEENQARLNTLLEEVKSLTNFEMDLSNKMQFLLDAILGFINTEQNDIFKVLTIVSVIGIPPTFIASWYGMNFHHIPEYAWIHGYLYVIILTIISCIIPLLWFLWRGWL